MKFIATLMLFAMSAAPKEYPAHVHLKQVHSQISVQKGTEEINGVYAEGTGIVEEDGKPAQSFDFSFHECNRPNPPGPAGFPGRWKSPKELIILIPAKDGKPDECSLKIKNLH